MATSPSEAEGMTPDYAEYLLQRSAALTAEAEGVLADLDVPGLLARYEHAQQIGSSALGLMVWRDIDFTLIPDGVTADDLRAAIAPFAGHPRVRQIQLVNETGPFIPSGRPLDARYYLGVYYQAPGQPEWKVDLSFWQDVERRREIEDLQRMREALTLELRLAILWLKDLWHRLPGYRHDVFSVDIYDAVVEHGVRTPAAFDAYLAERDKPTLAAASS